AEAIATPPVRARAAKRMSLTAKIVAASVPRTRSRRPRGGLRGDDRRDHRPRTSRSRITRVSRGHDGGLAFPLHVVVRKSGPHEKPAERTKPFRRRDRGIVVIHG